jgi:glycosyltransferase involved in cell wall biosynthesis
LLTFVDSSSPEVAISRYYFFRNRRDFKFHNKEKTALKKRFKILISAFACNPYLGSEPGVGWGWVNAIAVNHEVWTLTVDSNQKDIEKEISLNPRCYKSVRFFYIPRTRWLTLEKLWPPSYLWTYQLWQRTAYQAGLKLHQAIKFDLTHQLTYVGFRTPGYLWKLDIPFVWGPIGGLENTPWRYFPMLGLSGAFYYAARNMINSLHKRFLVLPKKAFGKANGGIIAATHGIQAEIQKWYGFKSHVISEIGVSDSLPTVYTIRRDGEPLKLVWSGSHSPEKALPLLLYALNQLPKDVDYALAILGKGPCTLQWRRLAIQLNIDKRCKWTGWIPKDQALSLARNSHVMAITSLKDLTSSVLVEALSLGVPVICFDHCGFSDIVTDECGIKIMPRYQSQMIRDIALNIAHLWQNEELRRQLAKGALQRASSLAWRQKGKQIHEIYQNLMESS